jgi:hypothetical protein
MTLKLSFKEVATRGTGDDEVDYIRDTKSEDANNDD